MNIKETIVLGLVVTAVIALSNAYLVGRLPALGSSSGS